MPSLILHLIFSVISHLLFSFFCPHSDHIPLDAGEVELVMWSDINQEEEDQVSSINKKKPSIKKKEKQSTDKQTSFGLQPVHIAQEDDNDDDDDEEE